MIGLTAQAARQFRDLRRHYEDRERPEAIRGLIAALDQAGRKIERDPDVGLPAPRPYPKLARPGCAWVKAGRYWVAYSRTTPPVIIGIFHDSANIPGRF